MRKERVPFEEVSGQREQRVRGFAITEIQAVYSPDDQALATGAIERLPQAIAMRGHARHLLLGVH